MKLTDTQRSQLESLLPIIRDFASRHSSPRDGVMPEDREGPFVDAAQRIVLRYEEHLGVPLAAYAMIRLRRQAIDSAAAIRKRHRREILVGQRYLERDAEAERGARFGDIAAPEPGPREASPYLQAQAAGITMMFLAARAGGSGERLDAVHEALRQLEPREHTFVRRFYFEDERLASIAEAMQLSVRSVSRMHQRVKETLVSLLAKKEEG